MFLCHSIYFVDNQQHDQHNGFNSNLILLPSIVQCFKNNLSKNTSCMQTKTYVLKRRINVETFQSGKI